MKQKCRDDCVDRRNFVRRCATGAAAAMLGRPLIVGFSCAPPVSIGIIQPGGAATELSQSVMRGFQLGTEEASRAAALFARPLQVRRESYSTSGTIAASVLKLKSIGIQIVVAGSSDDDTQTIADACSRARLVFMNAGSISDDLRRRSCSPFTFQIEASAAMYASARSLAGSDEVVLWHPSLTRYGAAQLNDRFRARFGADMTGSSWAAWMAVKAAWEAALRAQGDGSAAIAAQLASESSQFDGHKGATLSFRTWDHQLRQPLYAVSRRAGGQTEVMDVPDIARSSQPARELLDTLGDRSSDHPCTSVNT